MALSVKQRWEIVFLHKHTLGPKLPKKQVARFLQCDIKTVKKWLKVFENTGDIEDKPKAGRPRLTTEKQDQKIVQLAEDDDEATSDKLTTRAKRKGIDVSPRTVRRRLQQSGIHLLPTTTKPLLTEAHRQKRMTWATTNTDTDWDQVIFTDETTIKLFQHRKKVWRRKGEVKIRPTVKHPLKVHIWGCFSSHGFGRICCFTKNLNAAYLKQIYQKCLLTSARKWFGANPTAWVLQEDNDPKHTSAAATRWREENQVNRMVWPPQSPDLNPIENLWKVLKANVANQHPQNKDALVNSIRRSWKRLPRALAKALVDSMPRRVAQVQEVNGDAILY